MLNPIKKHISQLIVILVLLPTVFQPFHIVWHHHHIFPHNQCEIQPTEKNQSNNNTPISVNEKHSCSICNFQFSVSSVSLNYYYIITIFSFEVPLFNVLYPLIQIFQKFSSRAPPLLFS